MSNSSAARTNLGHDDVRISNYKLGEGVFRVCLEGTYVGGNRNQQAAACKRFKPQFRQMEDEYFAADFRIADVVIAYAEEWNDFCRVGFEILVSRGDIEYSRSGIKYLVEPLIRNYSKWTSNSGWILEDDSAATEAMEAFSHFTYHSSGGQRLVCDLQGRHRYDYRDRRRRRFELSDPAICSRQRSFGPTDLGEKGIDSFFANHTCNGFCRSHWQKPRYPSQWFPASSGTSMLSSRLSHTLRLRDQTTFRIGLGNIVEIDEDDSDEDSW